MENETNQNWFKELFIDEAKCALTGRGGSVSGDQIESVVTKYLDENPVDSATATVQGNTLIVT